MKKIQRNIKRQIQHVYTLREWAVEIIYVMVKTVS